MQDKQFIKALRYIQNLDLGRFIKKSMSDIGDGGYNWDLQTATVAENRYKKWLYLAMKYGAENLEIEELQDLFWHLHILDTRSYSIDCDNIFGYFLHHTPFPEKEAKPQVRWKNIL